MPKNAPKLGGTEQDLEKQIHDDILDLEIKMNTDDFGKKAIEYDKMKAEKTKKKSVQKSEQSGQIVVKDQEDDDFGMFNKESELEDGDQNF